MSEAVDKEELQALRDALQEGSERTPPAVEPRNFHQPRRLSKARLAHLSKLVASILPRACNEMAASLRGYHKVTLASLSEINAHSLFHGMSTPFVVYCFESRGQTSWLLWETLPALHAVERVLSGPPRPVKAEASEEEQGGDEEQSATSESEEPEERLLSRSERRVVAGLLSRLIAPVAEALGLEMGRGHVAQEAEELVTLEDAGPDADARRLLLHFVFEGPGGSSELRLYLPGVAEDGGDLAEATDEALPDHLDGVHVTLAAYLGSVDVPLRELLALEVGDVIPLGVEVGSPLQLYTEDRACARATWGRWHGNLAVRILTLDAHPGDIDQPEARED